MTKGTNMKLGERETIGPVEIPNIAPRDKDRKSLLYQAEFIAEKKHENFLRNGVCARRKINNLEQREKIETKCEKFLRNGVREDKVKNDHSVIVKYDKDVKRLCDNIDTKKDSAEQWRKTEMKREKMWFPKISEGADSYKTGSTVIKFTDKNVKLDIYLPPLT
jgi:hypothetical protein